MRPGSSHRIGVVHWNGPREELSERFGDVLAEAGHAVVPITANEPLPAGLDAVFVHGPFGSLVPLGSQLARQPAATRPALIWWLTEQLWNPAWPDWITLPLARARSRAERVAFQLSDGVWTVARRRRWLTRGGLRFRYFGDFDWLRHAGVLTVLAVPSPITQAFLRRRGVESVVAYCGAHPGWESHAQVERDVPVLWLGSNGSRRRARLVRALERDLQTRGIPLHRVDGVTNPPVYGEERGRLLRRTKIVVNLVRQPWDCNVLRFYLSAPNRTMMITEPILRHTPVQPGVHLVEAPFQQMADTIMRYLEDDAARERISNAAYELVTTELTMSNGIRRILAHLDARRPGAPRG